MTMISPLEPDLAAEREAAELAACLFNAFSDRSRMMLVQHLTRGEHRVVDLTSHLGLAQSTVSKHLSCLLDCGIVTVRAQGRSSFYALAHPEATAALLEAADTLLAASGNAIAACPTHRLDARA